MLAADKFSHPTTRLNQLWQTDFTYFKIIDWGWYYLSTGYCHVNYAGLKELVNAFFSGARHLLVHIKCFGSQLPIVFCTKLMSRDYKQVFHRAVNG